MTAQAPGPPPPVLLWSGSIGYTDRPVVRDVDLRVAAGDVVALVGPNGCGKTTLVRGLLGLAPLLAGRLELFGTPAARFRDRARIGYVPQRHTVGGAVPSTVREVVSSGRLARHRWRSWPGEQDRAAMASALATVGLADRAGADVGTLSGGQQRRVLIARALATEPELLVMDEPTAGIDAVAQQALTATLARLVARGLTILVVTHETAPLAGLLTRIVAMEYGRVVSDGPAERAASPLTPAGGAG